MRQHAVVLFEKIAEPQRISIAMAFIYLLAVIGGMSSILNPPENVVTYLGQGAMFLLSGLLVIGGVIGIPSAIIGHQKVEESAIFSIVLAGTIYEGVIVTDYLIGPGNRSVQATFVMIALVFFYTRWEHIRHLAYNPVISKRGRQIDEDLITGDIFKT